MGEKNNIKTPENMGNRRNGPDNRRSGDRNQNKGNRSKPMMQGQGNLEHFRKEVVSGAPTYDLSFKEKGKDDKKFTGRCRLFVGNIPQNIAEDALKKLFEKHGQVAEVFLGKNNAFAFIKMDTRHNAEAARDALDSYSYEGRTLRVRLAAHAAAIRVKNLSPNVSNELLEYAFSYFGDVERAIVITDDRGRSTGEGIVEFARKSAAQAALKKCSQECFMLTSVPTPVDVEPFDQKDEDEGLTEKHLNRNSEFLQEREVGPRFADHGTFEHDFGMRWKHLFELEKQKRERLENEIREDRTLLSEQMECARVEHQTSILREQLRQMEERTNQFSSARTNQMEEERRRDEERKRKEAHMRQQTEELIRFNKTPNRDFGSLRRAENELRSKASALQNILDRQEQTMRQATAGVGNGAPEPIFGNRMNVPPMNEMVGRNGPSGHIPPFQNNIMFDPELVGHGSLGGPPMGGPRGPMPGEMGPGPGQFAGGQQRIDRPFNPGMNKRRRY